MPIRYCSPLLIGDGLVAVLVAGVGAQSPAQGQVVITESGQRLRVDPVATDLDTIWDMVWAPDGEMWVTERPGRVSRVDDHTGGDAPGGEIANVYEPGESGLMGMGFHPDFPTEPWIYLVHSYGSEAEIRNRLIRVRYANGRLGAPEILIDGMLGRRNHDVSRLVFGPDRLLYMTMGDAGLPEFAQDSESLNGKLLRLTLAPDGRRATAIEQLFENEYGRLRDVLVGPDGHVYIATSNHDGHANRRGVQIGPFEGDDKVLRIGPG